MERRAIVWNGQAYAFEYKQDSATEVPPDYREVIICEMFMEITNLRTRLAAKEQFEAGCEKAIEVIKALDTNHDAESYNCGCVSARSAIERIREAAKEGK